MEDTINLSNENKQHVETNFNSEYYIISHILFEHPFNKEYFDIVDLLAIESKVISLKDQTIDFFSIKDKLNDLTNISNLNSQPHLQALSQENKDEINNFLLNQQEYLSYLINSHVRHHFLKDPESGKSFYDQTLDNFSENTKSTHHQTKQTKTYLLLNIIISRVIQENLAKEIFNNISNIDNFPNQLHKKYEAILELINGNQARLKMLGDGFYKFNQNLNVIEKEIKLSNYNKMIDTFKDIKNYNIELYKLNKELLLFFKNSFKSDRYPNYKNCVKDTILLLDISYANLRSLFGKIKLIELYKDELDLSKEKILHDYKGIDNCEILKPNTKKQNNDQRE